MVKCLISLQVFFATFRLVLSIEQNLTCNGGPGLKEHLKLLVYRGGLEDFFVEPSFGEHAITIKPPVGEPPRWCFF